MQAEVLLTVRVEMSVYDTLPKPVRQVISQSPRDIDPLEVKSMLDRGVSAERMVAIIKAMGRGAIL